MSDDYSLGLNSDLHPLGEFLDIIKERREGPLPIYSVTLRDGMQRRDGLGRIIQSDLNNEDNLFAAKNDICYNMMRMWQGASGIAPEDCLVSPAYVVCRPKEDLHPSFAAHLLKSEQAKKSFVDRSQGVTSDRWRLYPEEFLKIRLPIPPLPEQKKIAEILSGIDRSIKAKELSIHKADSILRARKDDLMSGVEEWQEFELGELLAFRNGLNTEKENFGQGVPFVSYKNVYSGGIVTAKFLSQSVSLSTVEVERFSLRSGDILFTRTSETPDEIGFSCVFDDKHGSAVFNGFCIRGRPHEEGKLTPDFASFYLKSESVLSQMRFLCKYTTRAGISAESLSRVKVRIPDPSTQQQLANSLIAVNEFRTTQEESVRNLKNIKRAVSSELLSGRKRVSI